MRTVLIPLVIIAMLTPGPKITGTTWIHKVAKGCVDTLKFRSNGEVIEYDCEMNYAFKGSYRQIKDTVVVIVKDDSHSEDGARSEYYKSKFIVRKNVLHIIASAELTNGAWKYSAVKTDKNIYYRQLP
jgi:hypothetical protein